MVCDCGHFHKLHVTRDNLGELDIGVGLGAGDFCAEAHLHIPGVGGRRARPCHFAQAALGNPVDGLEVGIQPENERTAVRAGACIF